MENAKHHFTSNHRVDAPMNYNAPANPQNEVDELTIQRRTRSQLTVPDMILRVPLARSPLKNARRAQGRSQPSRPSYSKSGTQRSIETETGSVVDIESGPQGPMRDAQDKDEDMTDASVGVTDERQDRGEGNGRTEEGIWHFATPVSSAKKRMSPDDDPARFSVDLRDEHQPKRAKLEAIRTLGRNGVGSGNEYDLPLCDHDATPRVRAKPFIRASSTKPMPSPSKLVTSSIFPPRAKSVPLEGQEVPSVDLTAIPPSPRRSPSRIEVKRAPSQPPPGVMDVDATGTSVGLACFTNTTFPAPGADAMYNYTVNFATPRAAATPAGYPLMTPLSPLTPLPSTPFAHRLPRMQSLLAKKANANMSDGVMDIDEAGETPDNFTVVDTQPSVLAHPSFDSTTSLLSTPAEPRPSSAASGSPLPPVTSESFHPTQSRPPWSRLQPSKSAELMPPPLVFTKSRAVGEVASSRLSGLAGGGPAPTSSEGPTDKSTYHLDTMTSRLHSESKTGAPVAGPSRARPNTIGAMRKRVPTAPSGSRRMTRSVSLKQEKVEMEANGRVESTGAEDDDNGAPVALPSAVPPSPSKGASAKPSSSISSSKPQPPKLNSTSMPITKPPPLRTNRSSAFRSAPDPNKMKQMSLNIFIKSKPSTTATATTTFGPASSSIAQSSPSKIPLPITTKKMGSVKPSLSSTSTVGGPTSGRSLSTLSHALEKLVVPPPSRPNTSLGFVEAEGMDDDSCWSGDAVGVVKDKGKGKAKDDTSLAFTSAKTHEKTGTSTGSTFARPTASSLKRAATVTGSVTKAPSTSSLAGRTGTRGLVAGGRGAIGIFKRAGDRASKKTSLPTVMGSPVKGVVGEGLREMSDPGTRSESRLTFGERDEDEDLRDGAEPTSEGGTAVGAVEDAATHAHDPGTQNEVSGDADGCPTTSPPQPCKEVDIDLSTSPVSAADKGKKVALPPSLALNPASSALHALSQSLSSLPQPLTPPKPRAVGTRTGLRSATMGKGSPASDDPGSAGPSGRVEVVAGAGPIGTSGNDSGGGKKKSSLKVLKKCAIFVDVRTEQGDDAGSLFVDMLRGLGAKILGRVGQSCTHIVFKNGQPNTLTRYRLLNDPKPYVVGIAWVVECVEQRTRIDEEKFKVDIELINVAGGNKRRRSMLPKHLIPLSPAGIAESPANPSSEADEEEGGATGCNDASLLQDPDISIRSRDEDDLPPLERARRRRSVLPGGQTRLIL